MGCWKLPGVGGTCNFEEVVATCEPTVKGTVRKVILQNTDVFKISIYQ